VCYRLDNSSIENKLNLFHAWNSLTVKTCSTHGTLLKILAILTGVPPSSVLGCPPYHTVRILGTTSENFSQIVLPPR
jgi:hypothetical protein